MTNLIPPRAKKQLLKEYGVRVVSVWLMLWAAALLLGAIAILPVFILGIDLESQIQNQQQTLAAHLHIQEFLI